jgi:predicted Rossmann fold flavoprotein
MTKTGFSPDVIIVGAGASGLMCAIHASRKGLKVLVLEKNKKPGMKILISGGGRCNFTNLWADPREHYLSENPHFCIAAMSRYSPWDFIDMVDKHQISFHEKTLGQQFCNDSSKQILAMLLDECEQTGVKIELNSEVTDIHPDEKGFSVSTHNQTYTAKKVVLASGGLSLPKIASDLAYQTANKLDLSLVAPKAGLVPLTWNTRDKALFEPLSGISLEVVVSCLGTSFREAMLFTHRGLSGPAILQISSYWREGESVSINLVPDVDAESWLKEARDEKPQSLISTQLKALLPNRLVEQIDGHWFEDIQIGNLSNTKLMHLAGQLNIWQFKPGGSEGYRTAEVTLGGIDTDELSSKTMEAKRIPNLYVIGEAVDVTGWLGGYNFQWAWASAYSCALAL